MTYINPISGAALPAALAQERVATEKTRQLQRRDAVRRNIAADDSFEQGVESAQEAAPVGDESSKEKSQQRPPRKKKRSDRDDADSHIDLKA